MNTIKRIGLVQSYKNNTLCVGTAYVQFAKRFGDVVLIDPLSSKVEDIDLLILPGGPDVDPTRYLQSPHPLCGKPDIFMEYFDKVMIPSYIEVGTGIFGICRGFQSLAVMLGCSMIQHMHHETNPNDDGEKIMHENKVIRCNMPKDIDDFDIVVSNSRHHQAVPYTSGNSQMINVVAMYNGKDAYPTNKTVEAFLNMEQRIAGVQWHPEDVKDINSFNFTASLIKKIIR